MNKYIAYFEIAAFVASVIAIPALRKRSFMLLFLLLLLIIVAVDVPILFTTNRTNNTSIYNFQVPVQQIIYLLILLFSFELKVYRQISLTLLTIFIGVTIVTLPDYLANQTFNTISYSTGSIFIVVSILLKFYEMLKSPENLDFLKDPFFYMLFALLLFIVGTLPRYLMVSWLATLDNEIEIRRMLGNVSSILNYILYATYTIAFLWMRIKRGYY